MSEINRPVTTFDGASHKYGIEGWEDDDVVGVSSAAKIGQALEAFSIGSAWGFKIGYEGSFDILELVGGRVPQDKEQLRSELQRAGLTPWSQRDKAADRGTWVHDVLEALAQENKIPRLADFTTETVGHVQSMLGWYVQYRPSFVATEVQVASKTYGFAGRYDMRCLIDARKLVHLFLGHETPMAERIRALAAAPELVDRRALCLIDLKTSKGIYPTTHFPQLALYELASVEIGFPVTDCQLVLNTRPDGKTAAMGASWVEPRDILCFIDAYRAIRRIERADPETKLKGQREDDILAALADGPRWSREIPELVPSCSALDGKLVGRLMGGLKRRGLVSQDERKRWQLV